MKLPKSFPVYSSTSTRDRLTVALAVVSLVGLVIVWNVQEPIRRKELWLVFLVFWGGGFLLMIWAIIQLLQNRTARLGAEGVRYRAGVIAYSQYSYLKASFFYQKVTFVRKENVSNSISIRLPSGHEGRKMLYALSSATNIPVREDYFSASLRQPNGRVLLDPRTDLDHELHRKETQKGFGSELVVERREGWIRIATPLFSMEKLRSNVGAVLMLAVGTCCLYIFLQEFRAIDIWFRQQRIAIPGTVLLSILAVLAFGYPIFESCTERLQITISKKELVLNTQIGFTKSTKCIALSNVVGLVIQQIRWTDGFLLQHASPVFECILLTERETIALQVSPHQCHQLQGLVSSALNEFGRK